MPSLYGIGNRHGGADRVAVSAVHALVVVHGDRLVLRVAPDGAGRAGSDRGRDLADVRNAGVVGFRDRPVDAEDGDVGAVDRAAHIQAARQGDPDMGGKLHLGEVVVDLVHQGLDRARGVRRGRMAMDPSLGMDDIGDGMSRPADRVVLRFQFGDQRARLFLLREEELDIVPARETQVAVAVLVRDFADLPDVLRRQQPRRSGADRVERLSGFADVLRARRASGFHDISTSRSYAG